MPYKCQYIEIDPSIGISADLFKDIQAVYTADNSYTGLAIEVKKGANPAFWDALSDKLNEFSKTVNFKQFALNIAIGDKPQDFSPLTKFRFWELLQSFGAEGPLSENCVLQIVQQLKRQPQLASLTLSTAGIKTDLATTILRSIPPTIEELDLSWNPIEEAAAGNFKTFCQTLKASRLKSITLSVKSSAECVALSDALVDIDRQFNLSLWPSPGITDTDMDYFINAMKKNPYLRIGLDNCLTLLSDPQRLKDLAGLCEKNKLPTLQHLIALRLAALLKSNTITENDATYLPEPCIELMPIAARQKAAIITKRQTQSAASVESEVENNLKKLNI